MHCTYKINGIAMWINPLPFDTLPNESGCAYAGEKKHQSGSWSKHTDRAGAGRLYAGRAFGAHGHNAEPPERH